MKLKTQFGIDLAPSAGKASSLRFDRDRRQGGKLLLPSSIVSAPVGSLTFSITVVQEPERLASYSEAWNELALSASTPNVFYEPWMFLPALEAFGSGKTFKFIFIFARNGHDAPLLCGFFPLEVARDYRGLPIPTARLWSYLHLNWCVPLARKGYEFETLQAFFYWTRSAAPALVEFCWLPADGPLSRALIDVINETGLPRYISELTTRALLTNVADEETGPRCGLSGRRLKEFRRLERRLAKEGTLEYEELSPSDNVSEWIEDFLTLESSGWKGHAGTAIAATPEQRRFFTECMNAAFSRGQLMMLRLRVNKVAIAYKCNLVSTPGAFAIKIAYDESYSSSSPGVLLELENIRRFHLRPDLEWMDSCAESGHFMANRLWTERRPMQTTLIAVRGQLPALMLSLLPVMRWTRHACRSLLSRAGNEVTQ